MQLTKYEEEILHGAEGEGSALAMKILVGIGEAMDADYLVPIERAHISLSNQEADLWFAEKMMSLGSKTKICATVNPSFDINYFKKIYTNGNNIKLTERCSTAYMKMGFILSFTCTPYLDGNLPLFHENVAFSESSATAFVNSVIGARTNPESAQSALCAAIVGETPHYGLLNDKNRKASLYVNVEQTINDEFDYSILGWVAARKISRDVPLFRGNFNVTTEGLINLGAELNTAGRVPLFHIEGITPEAEFAVSDVKITKEITITKNEMQLAKQKMLGTVAKAEGIILGCPHYSLKQIYCIHKYLNGRRSEIPIWILTSASVLSQISSLPIGNDLKNCSVTLISNTCVDQPCWEPLSGKYLLTDSPKCCYYTARRGLKFSVMSVESCLKIALGSLG